jgi:uncharacterized protein involved in type VI secretion and phage assembly
MSQQELSTPDGNRQDRPSDRICGVVTGIVQDVKDPLRLGRVKVNFPWLAEQIQEIVHIRDQDPRAHSYWARVATLMAGPNRGTFIIPEVDDEVLVAFEHGQLDRPVIVGMLWNKDDMPPRTIDADGKNDIRALRTRSGHQVVFDDSEDKPSILIVDKTGNNSILIDSNTNSMEIKVDGDLTIQAGGKITITAKADISVDSSANLSLKATGNGDLETTGPLSVKSNAKLALDGTGQAELKAATVSVNGSGMAELKGGLVMIN